MASAVVFLADGFEDCEALCVIDVLRRAGVECVTAGVTGESVTSSHGVTMKADISVEDAALRQWDCGFCPGGMPGAVNLAASPYVLSILLDIEKKGGIVSAICASPAAVLGPFGFLEGHEATCFPTCEGMYPGFTFSSEGIVKSGRILTGKSAGWAFDMGLALAEELVGKDRSDAVKAGIYYKE